jgi:hypothetical protein
MSGLQNIMNLTAEGELWFLLERAPRRWVLQLKVGIHNCHTGKEDGAKEGTHFRRKAQGDRD